MRNIAPDMDPVALRRLDPDTELTPVEAAAVRGRSVAFLAKERTSHVGPRYRKDGRFVFYRLADVLAWMDAHVVGTDDQPA